MACKSSNYLLIKDKMHCWNFNSLIRSLIIISCKPDVRSCINIFYHSRSLLSITPEIHVKKIRPTFKTIASLTVSWNALLMKILLVGFPTCQNVSSTINLNTKIHLDVFMIDGYPKNVPNKIHLSLYLMTWSFGQ